MDNEFYNEQTDLSKIKIKLVTDYFIAWLNIISHYWNGKIFYIDLFCGPGCYEDGNISTPLTILENTLKNEKLLDKVKNKLVLWFNDKNKDFVEKLYKNIERKFENIQRELKNLNSPFQIYITNYEMPSKEIEDVIKQIDGPMFVFLDPWGYSGISKSLVDMIVDKKMSECIFFFNYNRIQAAIFNNKVVETVSEIFGEENLNNLRKRLQNSNIYSHDKEMIILDEFVKYFSNNYTRYVVPFCFKKENNQTSHYIVFVTKHPLGQKIMKSIMAQESNNNITGGYFTYIPSSPQLSFLTYDGTW
ncbi:hypothetical protein Csac_1447 [Caldicellulosiruptor saccharolyticus DSM 8903]|uniref:Three-Cys-motif partner protein TcmP n=1 Tax=Caldicellulosiruptor saccharolyticus (strain ATCC 43494 / DSM 8903 / Tp8T 6331) TaxID=351627 RepID=A4XJG3_CALS8|nr:three-Cys-motif partner protein TcmP [Caldicellulosiruptor saccharolyticus]ABP67048.1 hypothetical protein Csac_1447 [Caldicellulosiruptor saccharolyticus DSM 8903]